MIPREWLQKIRRIEIVTSRLVTDVFAGQYHSVFKGQGMEFDEVREYQPGDDIRSIDWNVTARTGRPQVKKFVEERELTVMVLADVSASHGFASTRRLKSQLAAEIAGVLAFAAIRNQDKVGLVMFSDHIELYIPPRKGQEHVLRVIREILYFKPQGRGTDIAGAVEFLQHVLKRKSIAFLISDFLLTPTAQAMRPKTGKPKPSDQGWDRLAKMLRSANKRHDMIAVMLSDPREFKLPESGLVMLEDAETGAAALVDCSERGVRERYRQINEERIRTAERLLRSSGIDIIPASTDASFVEGLIRFFAQRRHRRR